MTTHGIAQRTGSAGATSGEVGATGIATPTRACGTVTMADSACATFGEVAEAANGMGARTVGAQLSQITPSLSGGTAW
eukprot:COSAG03_NODE_22730_length_287_cov_1.207447_1_plen_77_part_01